MENCVFCNIVAGKMNTKVEKETDNLVVISDINPQAAVHFLIIPKTHVRDVSEVDSKIWLEIKDLAVTLARERDLLGFRLVHNAGDAAAVSHMHIHLLGDVSPERAV